MGEEDHDRAKIAWMRRIMPFIAGVMAVGTFAIIRAAGHDARTAALVGAIMFAFVIANWKLREWFGVQGYIIGAGAIALVLWRLQRSGWF